MNIRPMDLQVLIPRTTEVAKNQNNINQQNVVASEQSAAEWQKLSTARQQQIQHTPKSEGGRVSERGGQKQPSGGHSSRGGAPGSGQPEDDELLADDPVRGHTIDIKT
ncbi:hypothetical protein [Propionispora vibrioides]|uniref:Uncharacterized protein n=1 Tax=Propionispora vibrioides TaxID=112903 RepID=A0A1H8SQF9_9FIRM|nr:hypothetical protein [Propionispora vibrioides]SEO80578.1 hypothetical protein SAMN04490178_105146 [Propionispora vibrioides]